jgi:restriction system protein
VVSSGLAGVLVVSLTNPEEEMEPAYQQLRESLIKELLETVKSCPPAFFEQLVIDLLVKMGYGGTRKDAGQATQIQEAINDNPPNE